MSTSQVKVNEKPFKWLQQQRDKREVYLKGGASSSKSHTMAQYLILEKAYKEKDIGILVVRKTRPAVHTSCWPLIRNWIKAMDLPSRENKSDLLIHCPNNNFFMFDGLDNIFKKKSIEGINYIWLEELAGMYHDAMITKREFLHLDMICRAPNSNGKNQIFGSFNPLDPIGNEWIVKRTSENIDKAVGGRAVMQINHEDNPFLQQAEHDRIEALADEDEEYNKIYRLGQWATPTGLIYTNWDIVNKMPELYDDIAWGLDFGYSSNPAALIEIRFCGDELYEREHIYETGLTNPDLIAKMNEMIENKNQIVVADCAEPKSITEIKNAGFNVHPCKKGPDSVRHGIKTVKRFRIHVLDTSENLIKEKKGYKWKADRNEKPLPEPVKFNDHLMDAERYLVQHVKGKVKAGIMVVEAPEEVFEDIFDNEAAWVST